MREIYTSPRHENIDRVVALMAEHGIETKVNNRSSYHRPSYNRFSYANPRDSSAWPQVEIRFANDLTKARQVMRSAGLEPLVRHADVLATSRATDASASVASRLRARKATVNRVRVIVLAAVTGVLVVMALKAMHFF